MDLSLITLKPISVWHTNIGITQDFNHLDLINREPVMTEQGLFYIDLVYKKEATGPILQTSLEEFRDSLERDKFMVCRGFIPSHAIIQLRFEAVSGSTI